MSASYDEQVYEMYMKSMADCIIMSQFAMSYFIALTPKFYQSLTDSFDFPKNVDKNMLDFSKSDEFINWLCNDNVAVGRNFIIHILNNLDEDDLFDINEELEKLSIDVMDTLLTNIAIESGNAIMIDSVNRDVEIDVVEEPQMGATKMILSKIFNKN